MLEIKNYSLEYIKGKKTVDNISLEVKEGDIFGFVGSNGAGKSTTIKSIVGINHITSGDILIDNISILKKPIKYKQNIAYIPDEPTIYENITGIEYLNFISDIYDIPYEERKAIVESIKYVDKVIPQENMNKFEAWEKEKFDVLFHGDDWKNSDLYKENEKKLKEVGVEFVYFPYTKSTSSTIIREKLINSQEKKDKKDE